MKNIYRCNSVYVRKNQWFSFFDIVKMGISELVKHRGSTYITSEIYRGEFILIVEILSGNINLIDKMLKNYFDQENFYRGSGTEFFNKSIVSLIIPFLEKLNIQYRVLNEEEIYFINKCNQLDNLPHIKKIKEIFNSLSAEKIIKKLKDKKIIKSVQVDIQLQTVPEAAYATDIQPNKQQQDVLNTIEDFFNVNSIGKIVWACGLGKAFFLAFRALI
jgi:hypothetical protein